MKLRSRNKNKQAGKRAGWGARIEVCLLQVQAIRQDRTSLDEFGALVADGMGRAKPYKKATVSQWISEKNEPPIRAFEVIAALAKCDPWWVVWEQGSAPPNVLEAETPEAPRTRGPKAAAR